MINIGSYIYSNIGDLVNTRCYPLVADQSTEYPFIIYKSSSSPSTSKDGIYEWEHNVEITIVDEDYDTCCELVEAVVYRLLAMEDNEPITEVSIEVVDEDFIDNAYVKPLKVRLCSEF